MKNFNSKFRLIFIPYLIIAVGTIACYTLLNWLLFIKTNTIKVDELFVNLIGPMVFPFIGIMIWLRPRIKLLNLKGNNPKSDPLMGYIMLAWFAIGVPLFIAQQYLVTATGELTKLDRISQIQSFPQTRYYKVNQFYIDKRLVRIKSEFEVSGKYNDKFDMSIYAPCPIFDQDHSIDTSQSQPSPLRFNGKKPLILLNGVPTDQSNISKLDTSQIQKITVLKDNAAVVLYGKKAIDGAILIETKDKSVTFPPIQKADANADYQPMAWLAIKYQKTISNQLSPAEKEEEYKLFARESQAKFDADDVEHFVYLDKLNYSKSLSNYTKAIQTKDSLSKAPVIVLSPVNEAFEVRNGTKPQWLLGSFVVGSLVFLIALLFKPLRDGLDDEKEGEDDSLKSQLQIFVPREGYYATPVIINLNLAVFIIMACCGLGFITFEAADLLKLGANYRPYIMAGQYWRLLTNTFLHGGVMHVLFNMYGLLFVGIFLEPLLNTKRFVACYLGTGILASLASIWWHPNTVSIGASGAIFGMYGMFLALLTTNLFPKDFKKSFLISTSIFVGYNLLYGLTGGIDNAAHIGGLLSGLVVGYSMYPVLKNKANRLEAEAETQKFLDDLAPKK